MCQRGWESGRTKGDRDGAAGRAAPEHATGTLVRGICNNMTVVAFAPETSFGGADGPNQAWKNLNAHRLWVKNRDFPDEDTVNWVGWRGDPYLVQFETCQEKILKEKREWHHRALKSCLNVTKEAEVDILGFLEKDGRTKQADLMAFFDSNSERHVLAMIHTAKMA